VYGKLGREADRQAELVRVLELGADEGIVIPRAEELSRAGRWTEAAGLLSRCGRTGPLSRELAQALGIACLKAGGRAGYREACAAVLAREWPDPIVAWDATHAGSLLALVVQGLDDYRVPIAWFERRLPDVPVPAPIYHPYYFPNALGGLLIRAGRIDEAIVRLTEGTAAAKEAKFEDYPTDWAYLALAHARKGNLAEAGRWLDRLRTLRPASSITFWDLQELALLRSEAEGLIFDAGFPIDPFQRPEPR